MEVWGEGLMFEGAKLSQCLKCINQFLPPKYRKVGKNKTWLEAFFSPNKTNPNLRYEAEQHSN